MLTRLSIACIDPNRPHQTCSYLYVCLWIIELAVQQCQACPPFFLTPSLGLAGMGTDKGGLGARLRALVAARRQGQCCTSTGQPVGVNAADQCCEY